MERFELRKRFESRIVNWKFLQARQYFYSDMPEGAKEMTVLLGDLFGDCGHFSGKIGELVRFVAQTIVEWL